ncbi:MAG: hypothetical protein V8R46_09195 [Eubacterium ramulus]
MLGFIDVDTTELAQIVDYEIAYPGNEQLKFFMVADRFMYNAGEFPNMIVITKNWMKIWL